MPVTNIDHLTQGLLVRIKQDELKGKEPSTWKNNAKLVRFEKDVLLTDMNKRNIQNKKPLEVWALLIILLVKGRNSIQK